MLFPPHSTFVVYVDLRAFFPDYAETNDKMKFEKFD